MSTPNIVRLPMKGKYVATVEQLLVGSAPQVSQEFWDEFFLLEPRAQWLHSTLLSACCARHKTAVRPWFRDFIDFAVSSIAAVTAQTTKTSSQSEEQAQQDHEEVETVVFGAELPWLRASNALLGAGTAVQAVCAAKLRPSPEATLALVVEDDDDDDGDHRTTTEIILTLVHAANAILSCDVPKSTTASPSLGWAALSAKAAAARLLLTFLHIGTQQQQNYQNNSESANNAFLGALSAIDISRAAEAALTQTCVNTHVPPPHEILALLALNQVQRNTQHSSQPQKTSEQASVCTANMLDSEMTKAVGECAKACATAGQGWGIRWLGFWAAGWLCGQAPQGVPLPNFHVAPCLHVLRDVCGRDAEFCARLFDKREDEECGPLPTKLFSMGEQQKREADAAAQGTCLCVCLKHGVLRLLVELLSLSLSCSQRDSDQTYASYAEAALSAIISIAEHAKSDPCEGVGDLSRAFEAEIFVLSGEPEGVLSREKQQGCLVDHVLNLVSKYLQKPAFSLSLLQLQLRCLQVVRALRPFCSFATGPDSHITVNWRSLLLSALRLAKSADSVLKHDKKNQPRLVSSSTTDGDDNVVEAGTIEGTVEHTQLNMLIQEALAFVCEGLTVGGTFAGEEATKRLWYECMRMTAVLRSLMKTVEPDFIVSPVPEDDSDDEEHGDDETTGEDQETVDSVLTSVLDAMDAAMAKAGSDDTVLDEESATKLAQECRAAFIGADKDKAAVRTSKLMAVFEEDRGDENEDAVRDTRYDECLRNAVLFYVSGVLQPVDA